MILFLLMLAAFVLAILLSAFGGRFEIRKPAIILTVSGFVGAVFFVAMLSITDNGTFAILAMLGPLICLIAAIGLMSLTMLWAYRRWSGFYEER
ncbi:MAG: hypothetical protein AAF340_07725 [Pseudomonadota bacterium]